MTVQTGVADTHETLEMPGRTHPVLAALAILPIAIVLLTAGAMVLSPPPIPLMVILVAVIGCCLGLSFEAASIIRGGKLEMTSEGLKVSRLFKQELYPWQTIERCRVMPATGTFGDNPLSDADQRVGVGLFLRGLERQRDHDLDADVVLCAGDKANVQPMMRIAQRVTGALERVEAASKRRPARALPPSSAAARPMRRRPASGGAGQKGASPSDLVARFRNTGD